MLLKCTVVLLSLAVTTIVGYPTTHQCNSDLKPMQNLDVNRYSGKWYLIKLYVMYDMPQRRDIEEKCTHVTISRCDNGTLQLDGFTTQQTYNETLFLRNLTDSTAGKYEFDYEDYTVTHNIIDTDYTNYSIWDDCRRVLSILYLNMITVLSRVPTLSPDNVEKVNDIIQKQVEKSGAEVTFRKCGYCDDWTTYQGEECRTVL